MALGMQQTREYTFIRCVRCDKRALPTSALSRLESVRLAGSTDLEFICTMK